MIRSDPAGESFQFVYDLHFDVVFGVGAAGQAKPARLLGNFENQIKDKYSMETEAYDVAKIGPKVQK